MPHVRVRGLDQPLEVDADKDLMTALRAQNVNLFWGPWRRLLHCRGIGLCALCPVRVLHGADHLRPRTKREEKRIRSKPADWRLACQTHFKGAQAEIEIQPFPLVRPEERVRPEAVARAHFPAEERAEAEARDLAELRARHETEKAERAERPKRRLLPFGRKKAADDAPEPLAPDGKKRRLGLPLGKGKKPQEPPAEPEPDAAAEAPATADTKPKRRFALPGKK